MIVPAQNASWLAFFGILSIVAIGCGDFTAGDSAVSDAGRWRNGDSGSQLESTTDAGRHSEPRVEELFNDRIAEYRSELSTWEQRVQERQSRLDSIAQIEHELTEVEARVPEKPVFTERDWMADGYRFSAVASLLSVIGDKVELRKQNGRTILVDVGRLDPADRRYVAECEEQLRPYSEWRKTRDSLNTRLETLQHASEIDLGFKPERPTREAIIREIAQADARRAQVEREAAARVLGEKQKADLDGFMAALTEAGVDSSIIKSVSVSKKTATITVANSWHYLPYQVRLQSAQALWAAWATIASADKPDSARIVLTDLIGNRVGGSRVLAGSLIWVQDR